MRITTTTICGTDVRIVKGAYPVRRGLIIGHEPVGVIEKLGSAVRGYREGERVIAGAITPKPGSRALGTNTRRSLKQLTLTFIALHGEVGLAIYFVQLCRIHLGGIEPETKASLETLGLRQG